MTDVALALAIPAFNEADGIGGFLHELDEVFADWPGDVSFIVVDDCSTDGMAHTLDELGPALRAQLRTVRMDSNSGHGPTVLRAYQEAAASGADVVLQVDGDGQFDGRDIRRVADDLRSSGSSVALAKRRDRRDPWFRKILTRALRMYLQQAIDVQVMDPNCPLRAYRAPVLLQLLDHVPDGATVPNVYLAILADHAQLPTAELIVEHRVRRGDVEQGTMWGRRQRKGVVPKRLIVFSWNALQECRDFLRAVRASDLSAVREAAAGGRRPA
jgi:glycosyltransferase involved in cell wall biosynthesis